MASDMSDFDPTTSTDSDNSCLFKIQKAVTCKDDSFFFGNYSISKIWFSVDPCNFARFGLSQAILT